MRIPRFLGPSAGLLLFVSFVAAPSQAQVPRASGSLQQTYNGATATAQLFWEAPDKLKIEVARDDRNLVVAQTILANGGETLIWEPATRRLYRLPYNVAVEWWRGWNLQSGGPGNFLFTGRQSPATLAAYGAPPTLPANLPAGSQVLALKDKTQGLIYQRDKVLFGGGGDRSFYAAYKIPERSFPDWILLGPAGKEQTRQESSLGHLNNRISLTLAGDGKLPSTANVMERGRKLEYLYQLQVPEAPLSAEVFALPEAAKAAVAEDLVLASAAAYQGKDAASHMNLGSWSLRSLEDLDSAHMHWQFAKGLAPKATGPLLAAYEASLAFRDPGNASLILQGLETVGLGGEELETRRARVALAQRRYADALRHLNAARTTAPDNLNLALLQAQVQQSLGQFEAARSTLVGILNSGYPQTAVKVRAAENLAALELPGTAELLTGKDEFSQLAQALLLLRANQTPAVASLGSDEALVSLALGFERAGREDDARLAWTTLEARAGDATRKLARTHLVALYAARGDVSSSLRAWREWVATLRSESQRDSAHRSFLAAWQKAFRTETLRGTLQNRSLATGAATEDLRLWLTWQELYGTPEETAVVVEAGAARFPEEAFWLARKAEATVERAQEQRSTPVGLSQRDRLYTEALGLLDKAVAADMEQPFYAMQRTLVAVRRAATNKLVIDAGRATAYRASARTSLDQLLKLWPQDPDVRLCAALGYYTLGTTENVTLAKRLVLEAVNLPSLDANRHELVFAAEQSMAAFERSARQASRAAESFQALLETSASPEEQAGIVGSYLGLLAETGGEAPKAASQILAKLAGETWDYPFARLLLENGAQRVAATPDLAAPTLVALIAQSGGTWRVAEAALANALFQRANAAAQQQGAPAAADRAVALATQSFSTAYGKLAEVISGPEPLVAARAAALLAEQQTGPEALESYRKALLFEPTEAVLHLTLIDSLLAAGKTEEAKAARDTARLTLAATPENSRRLGLASLRLGDGTLASKLTSEALHTAQFSPLHDEESFQRLAFAAARGAFAAGNTQRGTELFSGLALPQWTNLDRAAALADLSLAWQLMNRPEEAARVAPRIAALGLKADELRTAQAFLESIDD